MTEVTIVGDEVRTVAGSVGPGTLLVPPASLPDAVGWELKPSGLCRGDVCVPVANPAGLLVDGMVDLAAVATALGREVVVDPAAGLVAFSLPSEERRRALEGLRAPAVTLPDLDGSPHRFDEWRGRKRLLVAFSSWCGCREDLPGWQALHDELSPYGFTVIAVAIDHTPEVVRPFTDGISYPVLYDPQHLLTELYAISNVPTVVWIDEEDRIVRPNSYAFGTDTFASFTGVEAAPHLDAVRSWVRHGVLPQPADEVRGSVADLSDDEVRARLHFRIASEAHRRGDGDVVREHLALATALAPDDLTVWRAAMPLLGEDPFGDAFFERYDRWQAQGSPFHGLPALGRDGPDGAVRG